MDAKEKISKHLQDSIRVHEALLASHVESIAQVAKRIVDCLKAGNKLLFFGNGGSASDSQHLAAEFVGRYEKERVALPAIALTTDTSILTAVGNDYGFDRIFERQVAALGKKGDLAFAISTSGNSPNVIFGVEKCKALGIQTIGFLGRSGGKLKSLVDFPIVIPSEKTSRIQESHIMIGHILCELVDEAFNAQ